MTKTSISVERARVDVGEPAVIALSAVGESRWGFHQFPFVSRLPDGRIFASFHVQEDAVSAHGRSVAPSFVSADDGQTWSPSAVDPDIDRGGGHIHRIGEGEYLFGGREATFDTRAVALPPQAGDIFDYRRIPYYRFSELPAAMQEYVRTTPANRWTQARPTWTPERTAWDTRDALVMVADGGFADKPSAEAPLIEGGGEIFSPQYRMAYAREDGSLPGGSESHLMVSLDGARTFERRSSFRQSGNENITEPVVAWNSRGELVCVFRRGDHRQLLPMGICFSKNAGRTWTAPTDVMPIGVCPHLLRLDNGVLVLTFGRPGVYVSFSLDGTGDSWSRPLMVKDGDVFDVGGTTCGYTSLLPLTADSFLMLYSDFRWPTPHCQGELPAAAPTSHHVTPIPYAGPIGTCKAILARRFRVRV